MLADRDPSELNDEVRTLVRDLPNGDAAAVKSVLAIGAGQRQCEADRTCARGRGHRTRPAPDVALEPTDWLILIAEFDKDDVVISQAIGSQFLAQLAEQQIARTLVCTALVAIALFGALNFVAADRLLRAGTQEQLASVAQARARSIELGAARLLSRVSTASDDLGVAQAVQDFEAAFAGVGDEALARQSSCR